MLSKRAKYAIKTILFLYENQNQVPISAKAISQAENIPYKFLENILRDLKSHQIVKSLRGAEGGYSLGKDPANISVAELMRVIDGPIALIPCVSENFYESCNECKDEETCRIRKIFGQLRDEMLKVLKSSIIDLSKL
ncbi:RrF2 family transcriptional regulator [Arthrospiribacter ruber]|jgi:Rrf2 family protein|uniref:Rrf2 family transcriptional regulator n=1 Tax=Arthrospiribacter ruber TaxID=2487934 RepID=A0A951IUQ2_9BACT|nr:Rrf2 family transcriptional regulator [Arthrospiribacter ruber]MBW3466724.1 Rrf2 family transcriptional regulator [Arthrospiribacter ruber]